MNVAADPGLANHLRQNMPGDVVVALATITPTGRLRDVMSAYHLLVTYQRPHTWLVVAGPVADWAFAAALQRSVNELNLTRAWVLLEPTPAEQVALRERADVLLEA